ncbi:unnamed protein product [Psylliodes chrysocephalus]|uniref:VPS9 domain-containing protein n=1 Tax=Psylliodes chrysocephalus TaxID=3402493 RepID=A0A9P0CIK6_9CUCU|nr:unnamed protein product [Psylliodes chrysocephala]
MEFCDDHTFPTFSQAKYYLESNTKNQNILNDIEDFVFNWKFQSQYDLSLIIEDVNNMIYGIKDEFFGNRNDNKIFESIHCVVHNKLWDILKSIIRANYATDDQKLYEKGKILCKSKTLPLESDETSYCSIPYTAAIVELSMLDSYNSPLEKLNCLCTTYDIIFAELKSALVTVISKYSEKELEIPIIDNKDIAPIMSLVFIKSKLRYPVSNLMYIKFFGQNWIKDGNKGYILKTFEQVTEQCLKEDQQYSSLKNGITEPSDIDYCDIIKKMTLAETEPHKIESPGKPSLQDENRKRLLNLIFRSTTSNNL